MPVIEVTTFRLAADATEAAFLEADRRVQVEFMYHQPGMLRRTTARGPDGAWIVITHWDGAADADAATEGAAHDAAAIGLDALRDAGSVTTRRYETLD